MTRPLSILALNWRCLCHPQSGGAEVNLFEQARRWARDGHKVTVVCADPGRKHALARNEIVDGVEVRRMGGPVTVYLFAALFVLRHAHQFDCILDVANGVPFFAPLFSGTPVVLLIHHVHAGQWFSEFPYLVAVIGWFIERRVVPFVYRHRPVITVSHTTREALVALGIPESQIRVVFNGTNQLALPLQVAGPKACRIAYIGRLKRYKRIDRLIRAMVHLRHEFPDVHLDIAGAGDAKPEIEALINILDLRDCVTMHGRVDEQTKAAILCSASVFATPSMHEGWGLSVIEANALGCPAVAYDVPGLRAAICHNETGLLAADDAQFEQALAFLLGDHAARARYSAAARCWAKNFDWESCALQTLEVLDSCALSQLAR
jgi:glycosyltransferase involved in cell wall biosynthesis